MAQNLAGLAATCLRAEPLVMVIARIGGEPFFATMTFAAMAFVFHKKHHRQPQFGHDLKNWHKMRVGFRIRTPSVPRASIVWLAHAVKVVSPVTRRLHLDRVRCARDWHLGITLGVCKSVSMERFHHACESISALIKTGRDWFSVVKTYSFFQHEKTA